MAEAEGEGSGPIECPRCGVAMEEETVEKLGPDVVIDVCRKCGGTWYDRGELARTITDRGVAARLTEEPIHGIISPMTCPRCQGRMRIRHEWGVEVDVCLHCGGVWLDLGEKEALETKAKTSKKGKEVARKRELAFYRALRDLGKE